jgi:hypothetical protein
MLWEPYPAFWFERSTIAKYWELNFEQGAIIHCGDHLLQSANDGAHRN